ncbi:MAG TPA: hypothetical protein VHA33_16355 [Candidatus Angelobacter sp.]|jgi:hypothetical protein|nr:hypothetical protein [Candidatus Angelobacter sp.]
MPQKNDILQISILAIVLFFSVSCIFAQGNPQAPQESKSEQRSEDPQKVFATQCGINLDGAAVHIFVNSSKGWKEYRDLKSVPDLSSGADSEFIVRSDPGGKHYVRTFIPGDDYDRYQDDCFGENGKVRGLRYELRTAWGWGYEESRTFSESGKMVDKTSRFFDTRNEKSIQPPERVKEVPDAIKPEVHAEFLGMPFIPFLNE